MISRANCVFHTNECCGQLNCHLLVGQCLIDAVPVNVKYCFTLSSSRAPLLAPSPLRTGLEGFPSSGSSTQKRPPENEDAASCKMKQTYSILTCCRFARQRKFPQPCVKLHQRLAPSSFALLHASVPQTFSSWAPTGSQLRFRRGDLVPTRRRNLYLPNYRAAFACSHFRYPQRHRCHLAMDFPLARSATGLPCSAENDAIG
jgi:hypothetical protein